MNVDLIHTTYPFHSTSYHIIQDWNRHLHVFVNAHFSATSNVTLKIDIAYIFHQVLFRHHSSPLLYRESPTPTLNYAHASLYLITVTTYYTALLCDIPILTLLHLLHVNTKNQRIYQLQDCLCRWLRHFRQRDHDMFRTTDDRLEQWCGQTSRRWPTVHQGNSRRSPRNKVVIRRQCWQKKDNQLVQFCCHFSMLHSRTENNLLQFASEQQLTTHCNAHISANNINFAWTTGFFFFQIFGQLQQLEGFDDIGWVTIPFKQWMETKKEVAPSPME